MTVTVCIQYKRDSLVDIFDSRGYFHDNGWERGLVAWHCLVEDAGDCIEGGTTNDQSLIDTEREDRPVRPDVQNKDSEG